MDKSKIDNLAIACELYAEAMEACWGEDVIVRWEIDFCPPDLDEVYVAQDVDDIIDEIEDGLKDDED